MDTFQFFVSNSGNEMDFSTNLFFSILHIRLLLNFQVLKKYLPFFFNSQIRNTSINIGYGHGTLRRIYMS